MFFLSNTTQYLYSIHFKQDINFRTDISKYFGRDSTKGGIEFQFRSIKADAKRQKACYDAGRDPQTLNIGGGKGSTSGGKNHTA